MNVNAQINTSHRMGRSRWQSIDSPVFPKPFCSVIPPKCPRRQLSNLTCQNVSIDALFLEPMFNSSIHRTPSEQKIVSNETLLLRCHVIEVPSNEMGGRALGPSIAELEANFSALVRASVL
jgi:hypothetical protein